MRIAVYTLAQIALLSSCAKDDESMRADASTSPSKPVADAAADADASTSSSPLFGGFVVNFIAAVPATAARAEKPAVTAVIGKLLNAQTPSAIIWELADEAQGCELRTPRVPFCDPGCGGVAICVEDGECTDNPTPEDVGPVEVSGLGPTPFSMKLVAGNYQYPAGSSWAFPPCEEGAAIEVQSKRSAYDALELKANCIAPLQVSGAVALATGKPLALSWTPPATTDLSRIRVELDISHHGGAKGVIECDVADTGSFAIPQQLVQQLVDLGVAGFPTVTVNRVSVGHGSSAQTRGVSLTVSSTVLREIEIPGLVSCTDDSQCKDGQTCQGDATCK